MVLCAAGVLPLPADWSFDQGCNLLGNYETAYHCLITRGQLKAGETVLILGASGSTGLAAVHIAKLVGAKVIAVGRSAAKLEQVRAHAFLGGEEAGRRRCEGLFATVQDWRPPKPYRL